MSMDPDCQDLFVPRIDGYSYTIDAGLRRTPNDDGTITQRRAYQHARHTFQVSFEVDSAELKTMTDFIETSGYTWFQMPLVSGSNGAPGRIDHTVRFTSAPSVSPVTPSGRFIVSGTVEMAAWTPGCDFLDNCTEYTECLGTSSIDTIVIPDTWWTGLVNAWGNEAYWGNLNG